MKLDNGSTYLKPENEIKGTKVTILNEGEWIESKYTYDDGTPKSQLTFKVNHQGVDKKLRMNKASRTACMEAWGDETKDWIGREAKIIVMPTPNGDKKMIILDPTIVVNKAKTNEKGEEVGWDE